MRVRSIAGILVAAGALLAATGAGAVSPWDPEGRYDGGAPTGRSYSLFGGAASPVPRSTVTYPANYAAGTIVINTAERRLYYLLGNGQAIRYGIGVGRPGFTWSGVRTVSLKREWPPENPLGARAIYLGSSLYRIHGSNEPETIGQAVSSGCFRLTNEDVIDLYSRVRVGTTVIIRQQ